MGMKENVKNPDVWMRGLFIVVFGVILYFVLVIIGLLVVFQFVTRVLTGNLNQQLASFSVGLTRYVFQILNYITFQSDERPFPFSPWSAGDKAVIADESKPGPRTRRATKKKKETG